MGPNAVNEISQALCDILNADVVSPLAGHTFRAVPTALDVAPTPVVFYLAPVLIGLRRYDVMGYCTLEFDGVLIAASVQNGIGRGQETLNQYLSNAPGSIWHALAKGQTDVVHPDVQSLMPDKNWRGVGFYDIGEARYLGARLSIHIRAR